MPNIWASYDKEIVIETEYETIETDGKELIPIVFSITNNGDEVFQGIPVITLPSTWRHPFPILPLSIESGQTEILFITPLIPSASEAKTYQIGLSFNDHSFFKEVSVLVTPHYGGSITTLEKPVYVYDKSEYSIVFTISNTGNTTSTYELSGTSTYHSTTSFSESIITLEPLMSREIVYTVLLDNNSRWKSTEVTKIKATIVEDPLVVMSIQENVEIIPVTPLSALYHYYSLNLSSSLKTDFLDLEKTSFGVDFSGSGFLDDKNIHRLTFSLPECTFSEVPFSYSFSKGILSISFNLSLPSILKNIRSLIN